MERLGQYLRTEREQRGMSLEEVATRTRIRLQTLEALERDDYPALPAEVTVKGFLRSYARCLGLDEQEVLNRYQTFAAEYFRIAQDSHSVAPVSRRRSQRAWQHKLTAVGLTAAGFMVLISAVVALGPRNEPDHPTAISAPMRTPLPQQPAPSPAPGVTEQPAPPAVEPSPEGQPGVTLPQPAPPALSPAPREAAKNQRLAVIAAETSWVQVTIDNGETKEALLQPGERVNWFAEQAFKLTVGNAGGVTVEFNGEALPSLGPTGKVRTLVLPRVAMNTTPQRTPTRSPEPPPSSAATAHSTEPAPALTSPLDSTTVPPHQQP